MRNDDAPRSSRGLTTDELMALATELAGLAEAPLDSGVHVPGANIRRVIFALDVNVGLLVLAKQLGYDMIESTPQQFAEDLKSDIARWGPVAKRAGISVK